MLDDAKPADTTEFLELARERYDYGRIADKSDREAAEADNRFANADNVNLDQWTELAKNLRKKRPVLQWNRVHVSIQQVVNDGRQNKPSIQISPGDDGTAETAEYIRARIRHIEYESNADTAKDTARDQQVTTGRGFDRVYTEKIPGSLNPDGTAKQRICIERIENQFSVVLDPGGMKYDRSDGDWAFIVSQISRDKHKRDYGKKSLVNRLDFADAQKLAPEWIGVGDKGESIQIAEYFVKEYRACELLLLTSAKVPVWSDDLTPEQLATFERNGHIVARRMDQRAKVMQYVINGAEILSETEWLGSTIPIIPFWGREATVDGMRRTFSLTRAAIFPQQMLNTAVSNLAEMVGQMPKAPWMVALGSIPAGQEQAYANINNSPLAYLLYNSWDDVNNRPLPPPSRINSEPPIQALVELIQQCIDAIKAAMGIYDASMGAKSNETSGIAIERRRKQSNITNYHFADNEARSNKYLGEILVEILPKVDKAGSTNPIRTEDGKTHLVPIGVEHADWKTGESCTHDLMSGQYGITVSQGPSYESARQEQYDRDAALVQADPELMWVIGDQMFASDDSAGSQDRAERMKRAISMKTPGLIQEKGQQGPDPQAMQQQLQAMQQKLQTTEAFAQSLHQQIETKSAELDMEKYKVDEQEKTKRDIAVSTIDQKKAIVYLTEQLGTINARFDRLHEAHLQAQQHQHEADQAAQSQQAAADQQTQAQAASAESQAGAQQHATEMAESAAQSQGAD